MGLYTEDRKRYNREYMKKWRAENPDKVKEQTKKRYLANPEAMKEQGRLWHLNNPEKSKAQRKRWRDRNKERRADQQLRTKYGITLEDKIRMIAAQGGVCATCDEPIDETTGCMDHRHKPFKLREVLCGHCNKIVGFADEDPGILTDIAAYLLKHNLST
jgi:hypothetical protein